MERLARRITNAVHAGRRGAHVGRRAARVLLLTHIGVIAFATLAMVTLLAGELPTWMRTSSSPRVFELAWRYTGQTYVLLGIAAAAAHASMRFGARRAAALLGGAAVLALAAELIGTITGMPFGAYHYTEMLGARIMGRVPYPIPLSWAYMLYCALAIGARGVSGARERSRGRTWGLAAAAAVMLIAWDVSLEVQMTSISPPHWVWDFAAMPAWLPPSLARPFFYGMPAINWIGWFVTATLIARVMLAIVPPTGWRSAFPSLAFPIALYLANGVMPIATTARHGLYGAAAVGMIAMAIAPVAARVRGVREGKRVTTPFTSDMSGQHHRQSRA